MSDFTPIESLVGGILIGISALILMVAFGQIAGISGILGRLLPPWKPTNDLYWRIAFIAGLIFSSLILTFFTGISVVQTVSENKIIMILSGLIVGVGTGIGNGCTSGHGVCGISRLSLRSIIATIIFMSFGIITVFVIRHMLGMDIL